MRTLCCIAVALLSSSLFAQTPLNPGDQGVLLSTGTYGDTGTLGTVMDKTSKVNYTDNVYVDPNNPLCAGCLDFVLTLDNANTVKSGNYATQVTEFGFEGYNVDVAYDPTQDDPGDAPFSADRNNNGNQVSFDLDLAPGDTSDDLIIYTNATDFDTSKLTITVDDGITDPPSLGPSGNPVSATPEPSSFLLLGTGLLGVAGTLRRRFV